MAHSSPAAHHPSLLSPARHPSLLVGLDAIPLTEARAGVGHYTFELARALAVAAPAYEFELDYPSSYPPLELQDPAEPPLPPNLRPARIPVGFVRRHWWSIGLPAYARRRRLSLFHGTNYDVPLWRPCPTVLTVHDLSLLLHPETHEARRVRRARRRLPLMARAATMIITPTESVRREVCEHLGVSPARVVAVPEAPRRAFRPLAHAETEGVRRRLGIEGDFILAVGTVEPRKNLPTLVRAFEEVLRHAEASGGVWHAGASDAARHVGAGGAPGVEAVRAARAPLQLVIAGRVGWLAGELLAQIESSPARARILLTGYLPDSDLRALYSSCLAFVYPSVYEGFGLPPLEAAACAAPVVAARIPALVETLGDAARLFEPTDAHALARVLVELADDAEERRRLAGRALARAAQFTWERTARATLEVYAEALRGKGGDAG